MTTPIIPGRATGRRRPPKRAPSIPLADVLTGVVPAHPAAADHFAQIWQWVLGGNNMFGTCGPVAVANSRLLTTTYLTDTPEFATDDQVYDLYRRSGNPTFDPDTGEGDNGVDMQTMCEALLSGGLAGTRPLCFASVDVADHELIRAAEAIFGCVLLGVDLHKAQDSQTDQGLWDYVPGSPEWGGHAVLSGRYSNVSGTVNDRTGQITWAMVVDATERFLDVQLEEAWIVVWEENRRSDAYQQGVDEAALARAYEELTGRTFPAGPVPDPAPPPTPDPVPPPPAPRGCLAALATLGRSSRRGGHRRT